MAGFSLVPGGRGHNYTGMLTRSIVFSGALIVFLATTGLSIAAIIIPSWISYSTYTDSGTNLRYSYGLQRKCANTVRPPTPGIASIGTDLDCEYFPRYSDCQDENRYFCSMWRSVTFFMSFGVVLEGMTIAAFFILLAGGKQKREQGWPFMATLAGVAAVVQAIGMGLMAYVYDNDDRFFNGWYLDRSWVMCTVSWALQVFVALAISLAAVCLPSEGGYELIPDSMPEDDDGA